MTLQFDEWFLWSDSQIVLAWLKTSPNLLKVFVANRVAEIQTLTAGCEWRYVPTQENPADIITRGLYPTELSDSKLWWHGSAWLGLGKKEWPSSQDGVSDLPELRQQVNAAVVQRREDHFPFERFSSYARLARTVAYMLRFIQNCKVLSAARTSGCLSTRELNNARICVIRMSQFQSLSKERSILAQNSQVSNKGILLGLTPFIDSNGLVRVGGRIEHSNSSFNVKHPIVLDASHQFTKLLFIHEHLRHLHVGPQNLLAFIREDYWPLGGRNLARSTVKKCVRCARFKGQTVQPLMGNLPRERVVPRPPFSCVGIDYAGPFSIRLGLSKGRGGKFEKCYLGLFICFVTKAVHLELISSLSTGSFLQALRRFVSRRGKPSKIVSDNGKNFVGASRELGKFLLENKNQIKSSSASEGIEWQFIPPYSPHMGGLWEANIKCVKSHLKHVLANAHLTFEEFSTVLCQIEAILNSRPSCPLTTDPNDLSSLTPAHFLIGRTLIAAPDENVQEVQLNRLTRFQLMQKICQDFWKKWKRDYISGLQIRQKWRANRHQLLVDQLVVIKDDQSPPTDWKLGRVVELHRGQDGIARVASIRTSAGVMKRSFQKICPLPVEV